MVSTLEGIGPEHGAGAAILVEGVDTKAGDTGHFEGEISLQELLVVLALLVVHDVVDQVVNLLVIHGRQVDTADVAVHANHWRQTSRQVQVGRSLLGAKRQKFCYIHALP